MRRALPAVPHAEMNWSMMPHGVAQKTCSHCWHLSAFATGSARSPYIASSIVAVATSSDAEDERPPPSGTVEMTAASKPA
jgi:hypothetical protein